MARKPDIEYIRFYTDGSAAKKLDSAPQVKPAIPTATPRRKKRYVLRIYPLETLALLTAVAMFIMILVGTFSCLRQAKEHDRLERYVSQLEAKNQLLEDTYSKGYDLEEIAQTAKAIGMVPREQVEQIMISVPAAEEPDPGVWERMVTFLTSLFA